ncbi:MAG: M3 family metallopeptidase [Bacteroidales bacterium]|nr:M3 family metallopeptidase [Bacteroidales bacterium]
MSRNISLINKPMIVRIFVAVSALLAFQSCNNTMNENPLLTESSNPYTAPAFDRIRNEHYKPAFEQALSEAKAEIEEIISSKEAPTFSNTVEALEMSGRKLSNVAALFFALNESNTDSLMQQIALEVSPLLTEYSNDIILNEKLFERIKAVYDSKDSAGLNPEQSRLLELSYRNFSRNGANLSPSDKEEFRRINSELSKLGLKFGQNVLAATNKFFLHITDSSDLGGLPGFVIETGAMEAKERSLSGWVYTLQAPSFGPFMQYSSNRALREKMWRAYNSKCLNDEFDNQKIIKEIVKLRLKRANLLGYKTHADYVLSENMAKSSESVTAFLGNLLDKSLPYGKKDLEQIRVYAARNGFTGELMPWDFSYYSEKYKSEKFSLNDEMLKPYFELSNVEKAVFDLAGKLYGLKFTRNTSIPVFHPDVKVFEVTEENGTFISLLYVDYFPRASKSGGAWMTSFREQYIMDSVEYRPFVTLTLNFTKPTESTPSLLTFNEVTTLLHEFGHALHGMLAQGSYPSLTGTSVVRDFVELPSQIMENWAVEPEFLSSFARHYKTGEVIPQELIDKIISARNYLSCYMSVRQLSLGINDMAWHTISDTSVADMIKVDEFERKAIEKTQLMPIIEGTCFSPSFGHIFAGGYSAGYYSYKWAEVLEADAFSLFKEKGVFSREVAASFRENILSKGNLRDADVLYRAFRGRDPEPDALLVKLGMK